MQNQSTIVYLEKAFFSEKEKKLVKYGGISATSFLYENGVQGLKIKNRRGEIIMLPYQGQQIWSCIFDNRNLTMKTMFDKPFPTQIFTNTYGGFLLHCGVSSMGNPSEKDNHPVHGELPNAPYHKAFIETGRDENGCYIGVGGQYHYIVSSSFNYLAEPYVKIYENSTKLNISMSIKNLKNSDMEYMYLMHINYRPVDSSKLIYSAGCSPDDIKVHVIPSDIESSPEKEKFISFLKKLEINPELHNEIRPDFCYNPEIVFTLKCNCDKEGNAYGMQMHPDGFAEYISYKTSEFDYGIRWISRTENEDALGILLPATAEHRGYIEEKRKGNIKLLKAGEKVNFHVETGLLNPSEAMDVKHKIENINRKGE